MPNSQVTEFDNVVVKARVDSRSTRSTFVVDDSTNAKSQTITREEYDRISAEQDAYIAGEHMVVVDGYIGSDPRVPHPGQADHGGGERERRGHAEAAVLPGRRRLRPGDLGAGHTVIYTPNLPAPGYPDDRVIAVDLKREHHPRAQLGLLR